MDKELKKVKEESELLKEFREKFDFFIPKDFWQWIESKLSEAERWISVKEPPKEDGNYIINGFLVGEGIYKNGKWKDYSGDEIIDITHEVTHWQPLPNPPKKELLELQRQINWVNHEIKNSKPT